MTGFKSSSGDLRKTLHKVKASLTGTNYGEEEKRELLIALKMSRLQLFQDELVRKRNGEGAYPSQISLRNINQKNMALRFFALEQFAVKKKIEPNLI